MGLRCWAPLAVGTARTFFFTSTTSCGSMLLTRLMAAAFRRPELRASWRQTSRQHTAVPAMAATLCVVERPTMPVAAGGRMRVRSSIVAILDLQ
jgi:hypothetical protein